MTHDIETDHSATDRAAMQTSEPSATGPGFTVGLIMGGIGGALVALAFAPRAGADLRRSVAASGRTLGSEVSQRYHEATARIGDAVDHLSDTVRAVPAEVADAREASQKARVL